MGSCKFQILFSDYSQLLSFAGASGRFAGCARITEMHTHTHTHTDTHKGHAHNTMRCRTPIHDMEMYVSVSVSVQVSGIRYQISDIRSTHNKQYLMGDGAGE